MESKDKSRRQDWRASFEAAICPLASSITVSRYGLPSLDNAAYRPLANQAKEHPEAALMVREYLPRIHVDAGEVIYLMIAGSPWSVGASDVSAHRIISDLSAFIGHVDPSKHRILAAGDLNTNYGANAGLLSLVDRERTV